MVFEVRQIEDDDELYRRIAPDHFKTDGTVSSATYKKSNKPDPEISVNLAYLSTIEKTLENKPHFGVGSLIARYPREIGLVVVHDPIDHPIELINEAHSLIKGASTKKQCSDLAKNTKVLKEPTK